MIPYVDVEDVDVVQFHALQRFIKPLHHGLAVIAAVVGILGRGCRLAAVAWPRSQNWTHRGTPMTNWWSIGTGIPGMDGGLMLYLVATTIWLRIGATSSPTYCSLVPLV